MEVLNNTNLKLFAMFAMILDHIFLFYPKSPYWFHWIGRLSAPIFVFCLVQGFIHTRNRKKYFSRLYILNIIMAFENYFLLNENHDMISILTIIFIILLVVEAFEKKNHKRKLYLIYLFGYQFFSTFLLLIIDELFNTSNEFLSFLSDILMIQFGNALSVFFILLAIGFYLFRNSKVKTSVSTISISAILFACTNRSILDRFCRKINHATGIPIESHFIKQLLGIPLAAMPDFLYDYPQWMMGFSFIPIAMYNGEKGKDFRYLFYVFYPLHLAILQFLAL